MKKLLALLMALTLTFQLVTPVFADTEEAETTAVTEAVLETEAPAEAPTEAPTTDAAVPPTETEPTETTDATAAPVTTEPTQAVETTAPTETTEVTEETTEPTEETLSLLNEGVLSGECGENLTWTLDESTGTLTISGTGAMWDYDVTDSGETTAPWRDMSFTTLVLEPGITRIGSCAFYQEYDISCDLTIPEGVTAIGDHAFWGCNIWELTLPDSLKTIESGAFAYSNESVLRIPAGVTTIGEIALAGNPISAITVDPANLSFKMSGNGLYNASGTRLLAVIQGDGTFTIPDTVSQVDSLTFNNCDYTDIHLGAKVSAQFVTYESPFTSANNLKSITVSASNPNYKAVDGVLFSKDGKKLIAYPAQKAGASYTVPDGVETILGYAFADNDNLTELTLPEGVKSIGYCATMDCSCLTSITLPASLRTLEHRAIGYTWDGDTNSNLTIRGYTGSAAERYALENGFSFESIGEISETASGTCGKNLKWKLVGTTLTISGTGAMTNYALSYNNTTGQVSTNAPWFGLGYTSLELEQGITTIGDYAFYRSDLGGSVTVPEGVTAIGKYAFNDCYGISNLSLPSTLKTIGEWAASFLFACDTIHIPAAVTSIGDDAFTGKGWDEITVDAGNRSFKVVDGGLYNAAGTRLLAVEDGTGKFIIPDTVTVIDPCCFFNANFSAFHLGAKVVKSDDAASFFGASPNLREITVSEQNPNYQAMDGVLFSKDGKQLLCYPSRKTGNSYVVPAGTQILGYDAFYCNPYLTALSLPEGLKEIWNAAVIGCENLKSVAIPSSVKTIGRIALGYTWYDGPAKSITDFTICGHGDGVAKTYAEENKFRYVDLDIRSGECGENLTWTLNKGLLTISGEGTMRDFSPENPAPWQDSAAAIKTVDIRKDVASIGSDAFRGCTSLKEVYYGGSKTDWRELDIGDGNECLTQATIHYGCGADAVSTEIRPVETDCLTSGSKLTLTAWTLPGGKKIKANWSLASGDEAYASITSAGVLTAKAVDAVQEITVIATPTDGSPEATKTIRILPQAKEIVLSVDGASAPSTLSPDMYKRTTLDFYAEVQPEGALTQVTWSSNNPKVASVAADGTVTLLKPGTAVIKAMAADGSKVAAQVTLNVIYTDHSPKLGVSALNLNTAYSLGTTVDFVERRGNRVETVSVNDDRFDVSYEDNRLTLKAQEPGLKGTYKLTLEAFCADGRTYTYPLTVKAAPTLPRLTVKQTEKFNLFYRDSEAALTISGGEVEEVELTGTDDFILEKEDGAYIIRYADPENAPEKPDTKATLYVTFAGYNMPVTKALTISTTNAAPKIKLNPTSSILNTYLMDDWTVNPTILGTEDESLEAWSVTDGVKAFIEEGVLHVSLSSPKTTTATIYFQGNGWAKEVKVTHRITVTDKKPTVKFSAKGKLDVLNPASEIVYTPKLTNATRTIESVRLEGVDGELFNAEVVDGLVHLKLAKSGANYSIKKTYKVTPVVTLYGVEIQCSPVSIKVTQSAMKLAKIPNQTVSKSSPEDLTVNIKITSPLTAEIGDVQLNAKTTAALRDALDAAGNIGFEADTVTFPAAAFTDLKPGRYTVILDVFPANAAVDTKPIQAKFTLTVQK